jgi:hypothetical protein
LIIIKIDLNSGIDSQDPCPDKDEHGTEVRTRRLQKLGYIRKDSDVQDEVHCPRTKVHKLRQENKGAKSMRLRKKYLEDNGKLVRRLPRDKMVILPSLKRAENVRIIITTRW